MTISNMSETSSKKIIPLQILEADHTFKAILWPQMILITKAFKVYTLWSACKVTILQLLRQIMLHYLATLLAVNEYKLPVNYVNYIFF